MLITGENGTGKGLAARLLHAASSRADKPLVSVNMGGLSENIFESELFGHVKGAFTDAKTDRVGRFELADGGTLFLDEIANVPMAQQAKLLRLLETGEFERVGSSRTQRADVRLLSAPRTPTCKPRWPPVGSGATCSTGSTPWKSTCRRCATGPRTSRRWPGTFLDRHVARYRKRVTGLDDAATGALLAHSWPGNVRELDHAMERAVLMATGERVRAADLGLWAGSASLPGGRVRRARAGGHEPGGSGKIPHPESPGAPRRPGERRRRGARPEPQRVLPAAPAVRPVRASDGRHAQRSGRGAAGGGPFRLAAAAA